MKSSATSRSGTRRHRGKPTLVVGIGVSGADVDVLQRFLSAVPPRAGVALVAVEPSPSLHRVVDRLEGASMRVVEAREGSAVEPDTLHVMPAGCHFSLEGGRFRAAAAGAPDDPRSPIDGFLKSLAEDQGERAVGIVLSGKGTDGALGLKAVRREGGMTMAQEGVTARFDSMPRNAVALHVVDHELPVEEMPAELLRYAESVRTRSARARRRADDEAIRAVLPTICDAIQRVTEHDFRRYNPNTLVRRVRRRLQVLHMPDVGQYVDRLREDDAEARRLFRDLLISITEFFREEESFDALARTALARALADRRAGDPARIWVPACATGEEVYTIGILVCERIDESGEGAELPVTIFGTDIDRHALEAACRGQYSQGIAEDLSAERLERFFVDRGRSFEVTHRIRSMSIFSEHNLIHEPPFTNLDLISCRNLLIYFDRETQARLLEGFHRALRPGGYLFLGPCEDVDVVPELFETVDLRHRIYRRRRVGIASQDVASQDGDGAGSTTRAKRSAETDLGTIVGGVVLAEHAPRHVVVDGSGDIVYLSSNTARFIELPGGSFTGNLTSLVRRGLRRAVRAALRETVRTGSRAVQRARCKGPEGESLAVEITAEPLRGTPGDRALFLVVFRELQPSTPGAPPAGSGELQRVEDELARARRDLDVTVSDFESSTQELRQSNEGLLSTNEELRSANEKLENSREEIRSANEALARANADLRNLLDGTQIAMIFLDRDLRVKRSTAAVGEIYNLIPADRGRPLEHITHNAVEMPPLPSLEELSSPDAAVAHEIRTTDGRWYIRRVRPYVGAEGETGGLVVTFTDVTELRESEERFRLLAETVPEIIFTASPDGSWIYTNNRFHETTGAPQGAARDRGWLDSVHPEDRDRMARAWPDLFAAGEPFELKCRLTTARGGSRWHLFRAVPIRDESSSVDRWFGTAANIEDLVEAQDGLERADRQKDQFLAMLGHELRNPLTSVIYGLHVLDVVDPADEKYERTKAAIEHQAWTMKALLDDLLDVARIKRGKVKVTREVVELAVLIEHALRNVRPLVEEHGHSVTVSLPERAVRLHADGRRLEQVLTNLLNNAARYTPDGGAILLTADADDETVTISVRDNGPGIPSDLLPQIFELFSQGETTPDRAGAGLGIGLALVKQLVELHGGTVEARSLGVNQGSEFTVTLPVYRAPAQSAGAGDGAEAGDEREGDGDGRGTARSLRTLVVEDNVGVAESLKTILEVWGHSVRMVHDGLEAFELATREPPDVALVDLGIPGMDGCELVRQLRKHAELESTTMIALTGFGQERDRAESREAGFDHYLIKPVDLDSLRRLLESS